MEKRVTYNEMRAWFLGSYYNYCRAKLRHQRPWVKDEIEAGYAYSELDNSFDMPVEKLMLEVLVLIFSAGRSSDEVKKYHMDNLSKLLREIDIVSVLENLPTDEASELRADLKILELLH